MRYVDVAGAKKISSIGLGTWQFGSSEWGYGAEYAAKGAAAIVARALELGVTLFDTAEIYGRGRSEKILGRALRAAGADPHDVYVATKIFPVLPVAPVVEQRGVASAARLGLRKLDLYQVHQPNPVIKDSATMPGMYRLRQVGLVDAIGVSNYSAGRWAEADAALARAHDEAVADGLVEASDAPVVVSNQVQYSLAHSGPDTDVIPYAVQNGRMVLAYSPLAQGLLSGRFDADTPNPGGVRAMNPLFERTNLEKATPLLDVLREVADSHGAKPSQIALAWVIRHPQVAAIPGASSVAQLESNVAAASIELTDDEILALTSVSSAFTPAVTPGVFAKLGRERLLGRP